jgi:hypothetical protein
MGFKSNYFNCVNGCKAFLVVHLAYYLPSF